MTTERDYLGEAIEIMTGDTQAQPTKHHLLALREYYQERIARERTRRESVQAQSAR